MRDFLLTFPQMLDAHARLSPDKMAVRDLERELTFAQWNQRANRLANGLLGLGLSKGARVGILAFNCLEWAEIYAATGRAGLIAVPLNFRLNGPELRFILENAEVDALIVQDALFGVVEEIRDQINLPINRVVGFGGKQPADRRDYEALIANASAAHPGVPVSPSDPWLLLYTSGTTGLPKGVLRNHRGMVMLSLVTEIELSANRQDDALLVMPMYHANSLNFFCSYSYGGGCVTIYSRRSFDPVEALDVLARSGCTFTSLVPTQYIMMLGVSSRNKTGLDLGRMKKMMISSAPARADTKHEIMQMFPNSGLFELYGSSEAGWVTMLHPSEQFRHLGSVGRECVGSGPVRLLDDDGNEVPDGTPGELFSLTPYTFDGYWKQPEKTAESFRGDYCSVGDMAIRDEHGFIQLVDRKKNMIISGGENIYPSEIEAVLGTCPKVKDVVVIGLPDHKWGERVHAVIVVRDGHSLDEETAIAWCQRRLSSYKRPRSISFVAQEQIPRNATGKVLHRLLREQIISRMPISAFSAAEE